MCYYHPRDLCLRLNLPFSSQENKTMFRYINEFLHLYFIFLIINSRRGEVIIRTLSRSLHIIKIGSSIIIILQELTRFIRRSCDKNLKITLKARQPSLFGTKKYLMEALWHFDASKNYYSKYSGFHLIDLMSRFRGKPILCTSKLQPFIEADFCGAELR
jgi:hypothetical protein